MVLRVAAALLALAGLTAAAFYTGLVHADLRIATGPPGSAVRRLITTFAAANARLHPRVRLVPVEEDSLAESARALDEGRVDLAVVRSDLPPPANGLTVAVLRRDVIAVVGTTPVRTSSEFQEAIGAYDPERGVRLQVVRGQFRRFVFLRQS